MEGIVEVGNCCSEILDPCNSEGFVDVPRVLEVYAESEVGPVPEVLFRVVEEDAAEAVRFFEKVLEVGDAEMGRGREISTTKICVKNFAKRVCQITQPDHNCFPASLGTEFRPCW